MTPDILLTAGHDGSLRLWDIATAKPLRAERAAPGGAAAGAPVTCLEFCAARSEAAVCAQGSRVFVWSFADPLAPRLARVLDHCKPTAAAVAAAPPQLGPAEATESGGGGGGMAESAGPAKPTDMRWLTRSDLRGLPDGDGGGDSGRGAWGDVALPPEVAAAVRDAAVDVPEVTHARWSAALGGWVTAADDGALRLWGPGGEPWCGGGGSGSGGGGSGAAVVCKGGRPCALAVDDAAGGLVLVGAADGAVYLHSLDDPAPLARYAGHADQASAAVCLAALPGAYMTAAWDGTLRLWRRPPLGGGAGAAAAGGAGAAGCSWALGAEDSEEAVGGGGGGGGGGLDGGAQSGFGRQRGLSAGAASGLGRAGGALASMQHQHQQQQPPPQQQTKDKALAALLAARASDTGSVASGAGRRRSNQDGADGGVCGDGAPPGSLAARLAQLGRDLDGGLEAEFEQRRAGAGERLGACYVRAAESAAAAAAAAAAAGRTASFGGWRSMSGAGGAASAAAAPLAAPHTMARAAAPAAPPAALPRSWGSGSWRTAAARRRGKAAASAASATSQRARRGSRTRQNSKYYSKT